MVTNYIDLAIKKHGGFFAFSDKQHEEQAVKGVKYVHLIGGLVVPSSNAKELMKDIEKGAGNAIAEDLKNNGEDKIIWRELANHEAQLTMNIDDTMLALSGYGIKREKVQEIYEGKYFDYCVDNNCF
jgi:hypothetical protein